MTAVRPWGCPKCGEPKSFVDDTGHDEDGYVIRNRRCAACRTTWATQELPIRVSFWTRAHDRNQRRMEQERRKVRTCRKCGAPYNHGSYSRHVALSKRHSASLQPPSNGSSRAKVRKYAREWARGRAKARAA